MLIKFNYSGVFEMLSLRQRKIEKHIDMHCTGFPFPEGVKSLFVDEEMEHVALMSETVRDLLKEVNKVNLPINERISAEQFVEYYNILMTEIFGEAIVYKLEKKIENMILDSYEKSQMLLFKEKLEAKLEAKEGKILKDKLQDILNRKSRR